MALYEHVFLARQDLTAQQAEELANNFKSVIENNGAKLVGDAEYWGVKTLNFRIKKNRKAHFTMLRIDGPAAAVNEMERQELINEDILRFITVKVEAHDEGPSVMMQKRDRDERRGRRDRDGEEGGGDDIGAAPVVEENA